MQAFHVPAHGPPSVLKLVDLPRPEPGPGEVLVKMIAVSVNHLDLFVRAGMPGVKLPLPLIPGCDGTGEIAALGSGVADLKVGQKVVVEPGWSSGTSAHDRAGNDHLSDDYKIRGEHFDGLAREYAVVEARHVLPLPDGVDPVRAAAVPLVFLTAWGMLVTRANVQPGETVLVLGGTSGLGSAAIQIARDAGARVLATAGSEAKLRLCRELGAEEAFDHSKPDWGASVKQAAGKRSVDVVVEHIGPATWETSQKLLARNGRLVTCGGTTGPTVSVSLPHLFMKNQSVLGSTMGPRTSFPAIFERVAKGVFRPVVDRVMPLSKAAEAHQLLEDRKVIGKIVLTPGS
jgi:NADPH:quinone reductase-like Zn-dependent oxidoreductase